jgi:hypothetical protein
VAKCRAFLLRNTLERFRNRPSQMDPPGDGWRPGTKPSNASATRRSGIAWMPLSGHAACRWA